MGSHVPYGLADAPMDLDPSIGFDPLEASLPPQPNHPNQQQQNQGAAGQVAWYDTDL